MDQDKGLWKRIIAAFKTYLEKGSVAVPAHNVEVRVGIDSRQLISAQPAEVCVAPPVKHKTKN